MTQYHLHKLQTRQKVDQYAYAEFHLYVYGAKGGGVRLGRRLYRGQVLGREQSASPLSTSYRGSRGTL